MSARRFIIRNLALFSSLASLKVASLKVASLKVYTQIFTLFFAFVLTLPLTQFAFATEVSVKIAQSQPIHSASICNELLINTSQSPQKRLRHRPSKLETEIKQETATDPNRFSQRTGRPTSWNRKFELAARRLENGTAQEKEMARLARAAWTKRWTPGQGHESLLLSVGGLPQRMQNFLKGPWLSTLGYRGLSEPFVKLKMLSSVALEIQHMGDKYPIIIEWKDVDEVMPIHTAIRYGKTSRVLTLPIGMETFDVPAALTGKVLQVSSGSRMSPNIDARRDPIMHLSSLLHSGREINDRPSQAQFRKLLEMIQSDPELERKVPSLGVYAPTGAGKSRMMGIALIERLKRVLKMQSEFAAYNTQLNPQDLASKARIFKKKVHIVIAPKPELVNQLARDIGYQIQEELPDANIRLVQFGGSRSQNITIDQLIQRLDNNSEPVVIVTSNISINAKLKVWESTAQLERLLGYTNFIGLDEAHHSHEPIYDRILKLAFDIATKDRNRRIDNRQIPLFILGPTATPFHDNHSTSEIFSQSFWSLIDSPALWAQRVRNGIKPPLAMPWIRIPEQIRRAMEAGEITAPERYTFVEEDEVGGDIFKVTETKNGGYITYVNKDKMQAVWNYLDTKLKGRGKGVVDARPRDSHVLAAELSRLSGKNFVAIAGNDIKSSTQNAIITAFRTQQPYNGRVIDAIVGPMREGMDFPFIGWYVSMKKTVQFPENIQGPGRAFRLFVDKLTPEVIFFGTAPEVSIVRQIKNLIYSSVGALPTHVSDTRGFAPRRHYSAEYPNSSLGSSSVQLNAIVEYIFREFNGNLKSSFDAKTPSPNILSQMHTALAQARSAKHAFEFRSQLRTAVAEISSFPFFTGNLETTWQLCDEAIRANRKLMNLKEQGKPTEEWLATLPVPVKTLSTDDKLMALVHEFRALRNWLSPAARALVQGADLWPAGVQELAMTLDSYIKKSDRLKTLLTSGASLESPFAGEAWLFDAIKEIMQTGSKEYLYNQVSYLSKVALEPLFRSNPKVTLEQDIEQFYRANQTLPNAIFDKLEAGEYSHADKLQSNLASRLHSHLMAGQLRFDLLSKEVLTAIDSDGSFNNLMLGLIDMVGVVNDQRFEEGLSPLSEHIINTDSSFRAITLLKALSNAGYPKSRALYQKWLMTLGQSAQAARLQKLAR